MKTAFRTTPYKGNQPYIFISYAHKNSDEALTIIHTLQVRGYRVWYDEGIDPGTEWDENIAAHVRNCYLFIALISNEYLESSNCKDELNHARKWEKNRLLVYLSDVQLPDGMDMRLSRLQAIHKYRYSDQEDFWEKLLETPWIASCLEMTVDNGKTLEVCEGKDSLPSSEPADTEPLLEPSAVQPRAEPEKAAPVYPAYAKAAIPPSLNETKKTASDENKGDDDIDTDFEHALFESVKAVHAPELVTGVVTAVSPTEVVVDIGIAHMAYIPRDEWSFDPTISPTSQVKVGDQVTAAVVRVNDMEGVVVLSRKAFEKQNAWASILKAEKDHSLLEGIITEVNGYGVVASIGGIRVVIPTSKTGLPFGSQLSKLRHQKVQVAITEIPHSNRSDYVFGTIKSIKWDAGQCIAAAAEVWANIENGKHYIGTVKSLTSYGAFVDIGGVEGLVHISELSWFRVKDPAEVVSVGDQVDVYVISFDPEKKRISLGMKDRTREPWAVFLSKCSVGNVVTVRIVKLMTFGVFAEIIPGVDGFIQISQLSDRHVRNPGDVVSEGDTVDAKIIAIDNENKKVSLSIRALLETPRPRSG